MILKNGRCIHRKLLDDHELSETVQERVTQVQKVRRRPEKEIVIESTMDGFLRELREWCPQLSKEITGIEEVEAETNGIKMYKLRIVKANQETERLVAKWAYITEAARERRQRFAHVRNHPSKEEVQERV